MRHMKRYSPSLSVSHDSVHVNIGNTYARASEYDKADEHYKIAEKLGSDHINEVGGSDDDGRSMILCAKRSRAFALKKVGKIEEARALMTEVIQQKNANDATAAKKRDEEAINSMAGGMESLASGVIDDGGTYPIN